MRPQTLGTLALSALFLLTIRPLSSQEGSHAQVEPAQKSSQRASRTTEDAKEDHLSLAGYFGELASQEQILADSYSRLAAIYKDKVPPPGTADVTAREMAIYRRLAEAAERAAAAVERVAAYHSRVAERVGHTPVPNSISHAAQSFSALGK